MRFHAIVLSLCLIACMSVEACRRPAKDYDPDVFPEPGADDGVGGPPNSRKKRHVVTSPHDVDHDLSDFFTTCMFDKTGSVFTSWRAVVDFVLRDTRWYSASDEQFCERTYDDEIPVRCWQDRFDKLVKLSSKLLPKAKECMQEYAWSKETPIRGKRGVRVSTPQSSSITIDVCLGVSTKQYGSCVEDNLLTKRNLAIYGSLKAYNQRSIDSFVSNHYSDCRITSQYNSFSGNVYDENCPNLYSPFDIVLPPAPSVPQCLSTTYKEIVRTTSPLFAATKTCIKKYSNDKCRNVRCWRPHEQCDPSTGRCVCEPGYDKNNIGICVEQNKCLTRFCGGRNEVCDPTTGNCVCIQGYVRNQRGDCVMMSKCALVFCGGQFETCDQATGSCVCLPSYVRDMNGICREQATDPCDKKVCGVGERCVIYGESGFCICLEGYERVVPGICREPNNCRQRDCGRHGRCVMRRGSPICICNPGYEERDGKCTDVCENINCGPNGRCVGGNCICDAGFRRVNGRCETINPCAAVRCGRFMECKVGPAGNPGCVCIPGYVPDPALGGAGCMLPPDPCANVNCGQYGRCSRGRCICNRGYTEVNRRCVAIDHCATVRCAQNMRCEVLNQANGRTRCVCLPGFVPIPTRPGCIRRDACANVNCGPNGRCRDGRCICDAGYQEVEGRCVEIDHCATARCAQNQECQVVNQATGQTRCVCLSGFVPNPSGPGCIRINPCAGINCGPNGRCSGGRCICDAGYREVNRRCVAIDHCASERCAQNQECEVVNQATGRTRCVCLSEFVPNPSGPGCVRRNPCDGVTCPPNSRCRNGDCECDDGFRETSDGQCERINRCDGIRCPTNMRCIVQGQSTRCICLSGFVQNQDGPGCIREGTCGGETCPEHAVCILRECLCEPPYKKDASGNCVLGSICDDFTCQRNEECVVNADDLPECRCMTGFVRNPSGAGCITDPCSSLQCGENSRCVRGRCRCEPGFREDENQRCVTFDACDGFCGGNEDCRIVNRRPQCFCKQGFELNNFRECVPSTVTCGGRTCEKNMVCRNNQCECAPGHVPDPSGVGCEQVTVDPCQNVQCERNMECRGGQCECMSGFNPAPPGVQGCIPPPPTCPSDKVQATCPTMCPRTCDNLNPTNCPSGCRPGVTCVCRPGQVERSSTNSQCINPSNCPRTGVCNPNPCKNEGTCSPNGSSHTCQCKQGYTGPNCERGCGEVCTENGHGRCRGGRCRCSTGFFLDENGRCNP